MVDTFVKPYDYATDGTFSRPSTAWAEDLGSSPLTVTTYASNVRRTAVINSENWLWLEGARRNLVANNTAMWAVPWVNLAQDASPQSPAGTDTGRITAGATATADYANGIAWQGVQSLYVRGNAALDVLQLGITNPTLTSSNLGSISTDWTRHVINRAANSPTNTFRIICTNSTNFINAWAAEYQIEPSGNYNARFASQPILTLLGAVTRERDELFFDNAITAEVNQRLQGFRITFRPEFRDFDTLDGHRHVLLSIVDPTTLNTLFRLVLEDEPGVGDRVRAEVVATGSVVTTGAVTFSVDQELSVEIRKAGELVLSGFTTGDGTFTGTAFDFPPGHLYLGAEAPGISTAASRIEIFSLVAPLEFLVTQPDLASATEQSRTTVRVGYSAPVKQTNPAEADDALNPANYTPSAGVTLPAISSVASVSPTEVDLTFAALIPGGEEITLAAANTVTSTFPPTPVSAATVQFTSVANPTVTSAVPTSLTTLQVNFSENMKQTDAMEADDALNPANYSLSAGVTLPAIASVATGATNSQTVLTFASELPEGEVITVGVMNMVAELDGAVVATDTVLFTSLESPRLTRVEQTALNMFRVTFSQPVRQLNPNAPDDALNPSNYVVTIFGGSAPLVQSIVGSQNNLTAIVNTDQPLPAEETVTVSAQNIVPASELPVPITDDQFTFVAFAAERAPAEQPLPLAGRFDLSNPQTPREAGPDPLGTFQITEVGDIRNDTGRAYLRKRIFRRLSTTPGGFFHLPDYGLRPQDKQPITATTLRELQLNIESQVRREPDVIAARAILSELTPGVISVRLRVEDNLGMFEMQGRLTMNGDVI